MQGLDIAKRFRAPVLSSMILHREAHVARLNEVIAGHFLSVGEELASCKLVVLSAPAGYGKTTLLADFSQHTSLPCCWYFLDQTDVDKTKFLRSLALSIRYRFPNFGTALDPLLSALMAADVHHPPQFEAMIDAITVTMASEITERFAIILCNYHEVNTSQGVNDVVNQLLQKLPSQCVLVIESRSIPDLDFVSLLARNEVIGFDRTFLRFTTEEIRDLARLRGTASLDDKEAEQLITLFDGWIAGILLGTHLGNWHMLHSHKEIYTPLSGVQVDRQNLFAYLVNEVFSSHSQIYTFLREAAILQQMTPALCDALLERTDGYDCLQYLEHQGLFVTHSYGGPEVIYNCHPFLRELLCDELRRHSPEKFILLHQRAMMILQMAGDLEQAIYHALAARQVDTAAKLILEIQEQIYSQGRMEILSRWIDTLPPETIKRYPKLLLIRARIHLLLGEHALVLPLLEQISKFIAELSPAYDADELALLKASISVLQGEALFQKGEYVQAQKLCQQAIELVPASEIALHGEAHTLLGVCANELGDYTLGISHLQKALQFWGRNSERRQVAKLHNTLARTYALIGNFALAEHHLTRASKCYDRLQDGWGKTNNLLNMGMIKQRQGEFSQAEAFFQEALAIARGPIHFRRGEAYALVNLGDLYQEQGFYDQSLRITEDALALAHQLKERYLTICTLCTLAMTYLLMGDPETAMVLASEVSLENFSGTNGGYERVNYELTRGTILLYQCQLDEAYSCLSELESYLHTIGLRWELLCTTLRLVECLLRQERIPEALSRIDEITPLILSRDFKQAVLRELRLLPTLEKAIRNMAELELLYPLLETKKTVPEIKQQEPLPEPVSSVSNLAISPKSQLKILALGDPLILIDEEPITQWRMTGAMELFFLLLDSGHPLTKEQIITALWPETVDGSNQKFHLTIHYLRKTLGKPCIVSRMGSYLLDLPSLYQIWYDVTTFQDHYAKAKEALTANEDVTARTEMLAVVNLYRGDFVQSFYSNWCVFQRDKLRLAYLDARQQLALIAWRNQQFDESASHWLCILAIDECLEDAHYGLMRCFMRQGKRGLALRQYQRCVEVLQREMGVEPGAAIQGLLSRLKKPSTNES